MTFEIGQLDPAPTGQLTAAPVPGRRPAAGACGRPAAARTDTVDADVIPASPPPEVLAEVDAAWERAARARRRRTASCTSSPTRRPGA